MLTLVVTSLIPVAEIRKPGVTFTSSTQLAGTKTPLVLVTAVGLLSQIYLKPPEVELGLFMTSLTQLVCDENGVDEFVVVLPTGMSCVETARKMSGVWVIVKYLLQCADVTRSKSFPL
jgi:hypothetical protein